MTTPKRRAPDVTCKRCGKTGTSKRSGLCVLCDPPGVSGPRRAETLRWWRLRRRNVEAMERRAALGLPLHGG